MSHQKKKYLVQNPNEEIPDWNSAAVKNKCLNFGHDYFNTLAKLVVPEDYWCFDQNEAPLVYRPNIFKFDTISFPLHLSLEDGASLDIGSIIDHRDESGRFVLAKVIDRRGSSLRIHYDGWGSKYDCWSNYKREIHRFARAGFVSRRKSVLTQYVFKDSPIKIKPRGISKKWLSGKIYLVDPRSGQVEVRGALKEPYWVHIEDTEEVQFRPLSRSDGNKPIIHSFNPNFKFEGFPDVAVFKAPKQNLIKDLPDDLIQVIQQFNDCGDLYSASRRFGILSPRFSKEHFDFRKYVIYFTKCNPDIFFTQTVKHVILDTNVVLPTIFKLFKWPKLEEITIVKAKHASPDSFSICEYARIVGPQIKKLQLYRFKASVIQEIAVWMPNIEELVMERCRKGTQLDSVEQYNFHSMKKLKTVVLMQCGKLVAPMFYKNAKQLEAVHIIHPSIFSGSPEFLPQLSEMTFSPSTSRASSIQPLISPSLRRVCVVSPLQWSWSSKNELWRSKATNLVTLMVITQKSYEPKFSFCVLCWKWMQHTKSKFFQLEAELCFRSTDFITCDNFYGLAKRAMTKFDLFYVILWVKRERLDDEENATNQYDAVNAINSMVSTKKSEKRNFREKVIVRPNRVTVIFEKNGSKTKYSDYEDLLKWNYNPMHRNKLTVEFNESMLR